MAEKIIAQTIAGASEHFLELINEDHEVTETHLKLKSPLHILIEDPIALVNTFIAHNPLDVLVYSLWVLTGCRNSERAEKILGRPVRPINNSVMTYTGKEIVRNAGHFQIRYSTVKAKGLTRLDVSMHYESADAYEFLVEDYGATSLCLQYLAAQYGFGVGHVRISVNQPSVHKEHVDAFCWDTDGWSIGLNNFYLCDTDPSRLLSEAYLVMEMSPPIGIRTKFLRKVAIPALNALQKIQDQEIDDAHYYVQSMPRMLDWTAASQKWFSEVYGDRTPPDRKPLANART